MHCRRSFRWNPNIFAPQSHPQFVAPYFFACRPSKVRILYCLIFALPEICLTAPFCTFVVNVRPQDEADTNSARDGSQLVVPFGRLDFQLTIAGKQ
jgi:hypothetical protein